MDESIWAMQENDDEKEGWHARECWSRKEAEADGSKEPTESPSSSSSPASSSSSSASSPSSCCVSPPCGCDWGCYLSVLVLPCSATVTWWVAIENTGASHPGYSQSDFEVCYSGESL